jgi:hypothetical protein
MEKTRAKAILAMNLQAQPSREAGSSLRLDLVQAGFCPDTVFADVVYVSLGVVNRHSGDLVTSSLDMDHMLPLHACSKSSRDPMICTPRKSASLMLWTTLAPKLAPLGTSGCNANHINAGRQPLPEVGAQRRSVPLCIRYGYMPILLLGTLTWCRHHHHRTQVHHGHTW